MPASFRPIQQLMGQVSSHEIQYQWGQPLDQLGMVAPRPITSPRIKNQRTCVAGRRGANRAQTQAQRIEITTKKAVLARSGGLEGMCPLSNWPGKIRVRMGSVQRTRMMERA